MGNCEGGVHRAPSPRLFAKCWRRSGQASRPTCFRVLVPVLGLEDWVALSFLPLPTSRWSEVTPTAPSKPALTNNDERVSLPLLKLLLTLVRDDSRALNSVDPRI